MQFFLDDCDQYIGRYSDPDLGLDRVLAGAEERLDAQVLLDPFEEQLDLPTLSVQRTNSQCGQRQVVGQEFLSLAGIFVEIGDAAQYVWVTFAIDRAIETHLMVADVASEGVDPLAPHDLALQVVLGAGDKKGAGRVQPIQSDKIDVGLVHDVVGSGLNQPLLRQQVEHPNIVQLAIADMNKAWDRSAQIDQRVQLDCRLGRAKRCSGKQRQAKIDRGRIQRVDCRPHQGFEFRADRIVGIQGASDADQMLRQICKYRPWPRAIGVRQGVARDRLAAKPQTIKMPRLRAKIDLDVAQRLAPGQLSERECEKLVVAGELLDLVLGTMPLDHACKSH